MSLDVNKNEANDEIMSLNNERPVDGEGQVEKEQLYHLNVVLPSGPATRTIRILASPQESPTDLRQNLISHPLTHHLTNYHFEHNGKALNEYLELSLIPDLPVDASLSIVQDNYNDRTARAHFLRIKELVAPNASGGKGLGEDWGIAGGSTLAEQIQGASPPTPSELGNYFTQSLPSLASVLGTTKSSTQQVCSVKTLILSHWNPPPPHRRTQGDLMYIAFTSSEGELHHITGHIKGFYVSRSTNQKFDPTSKNPQKLPTHSLLTLLQSLSPAVQKAFTSTQTDAPAEILSDAPLANALPAFPWLVSPSQVIPDAARTQRPWLEALTEGQGNLRDWNDEIQSTRSLPSTEVRERLVRERLLQKSLADFSACATYAGMLVRRGELLPLDPVPETHEHGEAGHTITEHASGTMWHYNNIFLSLGTEDVLGSFEADGGSEASRVVVGKDVIGVARVNALLLEPQGDEEKRETGLYTLGTVVVDYLGERFVAQSVVPGIFQQSPEKKDEEGAAAGAHRIVYGGVDNGEKIYMDAEFDEKFRKLNDKLHIKRHDVWEIPKKPSSNPTTEVNGINGDTPAERKKSTLCMSMETKGLRGSDGRSYVLDLYKFTPVDITWLEEHHSDVEDAYPHRMTFLRGECVDFFWESKLRAWVTEKLAERRKAESTDQTEDAEGKDKENEKIDISGFDFALNPDVFTASQAPVTDEEKQQVQQDEDDVRACCAFLREKLIPELMKELTDGSVGWPVDGKSLTGIMHRNGVNVRYLGKVAESSGEVIKLKAVKVHYPLELLQRQNIAINEMVSRAAKHVFSRYLRKLPLLDVPSCIAHLLNCLIGYKYNSMPPVHLSSDDEFYLRSSQPQFVDLSVPRMKQEIVREIYKRFRYRLDPQWWEQCRSIVLLREVCLKMGFQLKAREYLFEKAEAMVNCPGKTKKATNGTNGHKVDGTTFYPEDILNVVPIVKDAPLKSSLAEEALEAGKTALFQGQKDLGLDLLNESLSLHEQIYGVLHPDVARGYSRLSLIYNQMDEMRPAACDLARKAVIVSERTLGLDNQETILNWLNWALCEHGRGRTKEALGFILHVLSIWRNIFGEGHPDEVTMMNNIAVMLQSLRENRASLSWFEKSLNLCTEFYGKESLNAATILFQYSQALVLAGDPIGAVPKMRDAYAIFAKELGPEDRSTKETKFLLETFTKNAVNVAKQAKMGKKVATPNVKVSSTIQPVGPEVAAVDGVGSKGLQNIDELVKYIGGDNIGSSSRGAERQKAMQKKRRGGKR